MTEEKNMHEQKMMCIGETDIQQNDRLTSLETEIKLMHESKGALKMGDIAKLGSIIGVLLSLLTTISSMWLNAKTEPTRQLLAENVHIVSGLSIDVAKQSDKIDDLSGAIADTLDGEVLEQRFAAQDVAIGAVQGQFERITSQRLQPNIDRNSNRIESLEHNLIEELKRQRDAK